MPRRAGTSGLFGGALLLLIAGLARPAFAQAPAPPPEAGQPPGPSQPPSPSPPPGYTPLPGFGLPPGLGPQPGFGQPQPVQPPPKSEQPPGTAEPPAGPAPQPTPAVPVLVPVIPDVQPVGPPTTLPSAPPRLVPAPGAGPTPTARLQLEPTLTVLEEYTDNFNLTKSNKQENFRSTVSPGFRLGINSPLTKGLITYTFSPAYDTATKEVLQFHSVLAQVVWQANPRWQLTLADVFTKSDQPGEADRLGLRQDRRTFTSNTLSLTSDYLIGLVTTRQAYRYVTFSDDNGSTTTSHNLGVSATVPLYPTNLLSVGYDYLHSDSTEGSANGGQGTTTSNGDSTVKGHQFTVAASRRISSLTTLGVKTSYGLRSVTGDTSSSGDFRLWNASFFSNYALPGRLTLDGSIGVSGITSDKAGSTGPNLFSASSLSYQFAQAVLSLTVDRGFSETFSEGQNFGVVETEGFTGALSYRFTPSLYATVSGSYRKNKSTGIGNDGGNNEDSKNWGGSLLVSWRIIRNLLLDVTYSYFEQVSNDTGNNTTNTTNTTTSTNSFGNGRGYTENRIQAAFRFSF